MKVYLAGPMTGYEDYNYPLFESATTWLRLAGYEVVSPHEINPPEIGSDHPWEWYMKRDIVGLLDCEAIVVLPGWEASRGATLEATIGRALGMSILELAGIEEATGLGFGCE